MFTDEIQAELRYYVYFLRDPRNEQFFYVGKGKDNRLFDHVACVIDDPTESDKLALIRDIHASGREVEHFILRHGMDEDAAFEVEAAVINFIGLNALANVQGGHYSTDFGIKTVDEVVAMYQATQLATDLPVILLNIGKLYDRQMSDEEFTRQHVVRGLWIPNGIEHGTRSRHAEASPVRSTKLKNGLRGQTVVGASMGFLRRSRFAMS